ncbi:MAG: heparin lyase I family protein [Microbacterium sp.]
MELNELLNTKISRRALFGATGAAAMLSAAWPQAASARMLPMVAESTVLAATTLYADLDAGTAMRKGTAVTLSDYVSGELACGLERLNILSPSLPLASGSITKNTLPLGWEWHSSTSPKTLLDWTEDGITWRGTNAASRYFGGIRTTQEVAAPGESVRVSFKARIFDIDGHAHPTIRVCLLRTTDSKGTLLERAYTSRETALNTCVVELTAPTGGDRGYRLVFTGEAGNSTLDQSASIEVTDVMVVPTTTAGLVGPWLNVPTYSQTGPSGGDLVIFPDADPGNYYLIVRTDEVGWIGIPVEHTSRSASLSVSELLGTDAYATIREFYFIAQSSWKTGWMGRVTGGCSWHPLRYMNIDGLAATSRPESPSQIARATGLVAASSVYSGETNTATVPSLDASTDTWAAAYDSNRWSYLCFKTDENLYIGETTTPAGVRSEIHLSNSLDYDVPYWFSFWFRANTTVTGTSSNNKMIMFQLRYTKNATGDSSALGPEFALEQLKDGQFCVNYRTDDGVAVLSGSSTPAGITTRELGPWEAAAGQWQRLVARTTFSASGGGNLGVWLDGNTLIDTDTPLGYNRLAGPKPRFGSYKFSDSAGAVEIQNFEFGTSSLESRIAHPMPV